MNISSDPYARVPHMNRINDDAGTGHNPDERLIFHAQT